MVISGTLFFVAGSPTLRAHPVRTLEDRVKLLQKLVLYGAQAFDKSSPPLGSIRDPEMRRIGIAVTEVCKARDDKCELMAIYDFVKRNIRYTGDVTNKDTFQSAWVTMQIAGGDCLPLSTQLLRSDYRIVSLAEIKAGDRIMEDGRWTLVQDKWITGEKPILAFVLNNGSVLRGSPTHKLFLRDGTEIRAKDVGVGDFLQTPQEALPTAQEQFATAGLTPADFAWLLGVYIADGWHEEYRFAISGKDGHPKEAQKRRVERMMKAAGIGTRWDKRYIAINDPGLTTLMSVCGGHAPEKRVPRLAITREEIGPLLEGLRADSGTATSGTVVHGTTSPVLALQLRVLYRMLGQSVHIKRVDDHGGLGKNPIYRVTVRKRPEEYTHGHKAYRDGARVKAILREPPTVCADITTETGKFWLPESDVMVHNCDDHAIMTSVLAMVNGFTPKFRITSNYGSSWDHIYSIVGLPKLEPRSWIALDTTLPGSTDARFGKEPPRAKFRDFEMNDT